MPFDDESINRISALVARHMPQLPESQKGSLRMLLDAYDYVLRNRAIPADPRMEACNILFDCAMQLMGRG